MGWCDGACRSTPLETILLIPDAGFFTCRGEREVGCRRDGGTHGLRLARLDDGSSGVDVFGGVGGCGTCGTLAVMAAACMSMHMVCLDEV